MDRFQYDTSGTNMIVAVSLIYIRAGQEAAYADYRRQSRALLEEYGGTVSQTMTTYAAAGAIATPDEVEVATFPDQAALAGYQSDPRMLALRAQRDAAVDSVIMLLGHPSQS